MHRFVVRPLCLMFIIFCLCNISSSYAYPLQGMLRAQNVATNNWLDNMYTNKTFTSTLPATQGQQSSGLLTVDKKNSGEMFYWLFRCANESAPMIIWLEGGPGIPGSFQVFYGMGPYRVSHDLEVTLHNETWNNEFHLLFFDNPIGVGYSSVQNSAFLTNESQVAIQLASAMDQFLQLYPEFSSTNLFLFGESYGGKYVPALGDYLLQNQNKHSWHLAGIGIGDGLVDTPMQMTTFADFTFYHGISSMKEKKVLEDIQAQFQEAYEGGDYEKASNLFWSINYFVQYHNVVNFYDVDCSISCGIDTYMWGAYAKLLDQQSIKEQLNVPIDYVFNSQQPQVSSALNADVCQSIAGVFPELLSNYKTLLFQGTLDMICNAAGGELWLSQVPWSGMEAFQALDQQTWFDGINLAGWLRQSTNLTKIVLPNAGHFVTMDQPSRSLTMVKNWVYNISFPFSPL